MKSTDPGPPGSQGQPGVEEHVAIWYEYPRDFFETWAPGAAAPGARAEVVTHGDRGAVMVVMDQGGRPAARGPNATPRGERGHPS